MQRRRRECGNKRRVSRSMTNACVYADNVSE